MRKEIQAQKDPKLVGTPQDFDSPAWLSRLKSLDAAAAETLCVAVETLYPHDGLSERIYRRVVVKLDALASNSSKTASLLLEVAWRLEKNFPVPFRERSEGYRTEALRAIESTPAFRFLQRTAVRYLYDDVEVWQAFGYEGASIHLGGYLKRGFDDLDWLPPVPTPQHR